MEQPGAAPAPELPDVVAALAVPELPGAGAVAFLGVAAWRCLALRLGSDLPLRLWSCFALRFWRRLPLRLWSSFALR